MIIDPQNSTKVEVREYQKRDTKFHTETEDYIIDADSSGFTINTPDGGIITNYEQVNAPYTNYQRAKQVLANMSEEAMAPEAAPELAEVA